MITQRAFSRIAAACFGAVLILSAQPAQAGSQVYEHGHWVVEIDPDHSEGFCALAEADGEGFMIAKFPQGRFYVTFFLSERDHTLEGYSLLIAAGFGMMVQRLYESGRLRATSSQDLGAGVLDFPDSDQFVRFVDALARGNFVAVYPGIGRAPFEMHFGDIQPGLTSFLNRCPFVVR